MKIVFVVVFALRTDTVTNKNEGEYYECYKKGLTNVEMWASPKLTDHQVYICVGAKAIKQGFERYNTWINQTS